MKVSWNWLKDILPTAQSVEEASDLLTDIGLEVEGITPYVSIPGELEGLIAGEIVSVDSHPNADKLTVTQVDIGNGETLQIVCGAPNVEKGQKVIVAQVGTTIYPKGHEPLTLRKAKLRGVDSEGMICADDEVGLGDSHDGITVLPSETVAGTPLNQLFPIYKDHIIEIGLTANHADAFSIWGTAIELAAGSAVRDIEQINPAFPEAYTLASGDCLVEVSIEAPEACTRYSGVVLRGIRVEPSPDWMQQRLKAMGFRPINNVVDVTNYVLIELGQPLHAFDLSAVSGQRIVVGYESEGTSFKGLDDQDYNLGAKDLMIRNEKASMCIAGVFGGADSGVTDSTTDIFLESARFSGDSIRRTESNLKLSTDASQRFSKGTDPAMTVKALERAVYLLKNICGATPDGGITDICQEELQDSVITFRPSTLKRIAGMTIPEESVRTALKMLGIKTEVNDSDSWTLSVPLRKNDVLREIDIVEEVMRLYGYNHIPLPDFVRTPVTLRPKPDWERLRLDTGKFLAAKGYYEIFTNSISKSGYVDKWMPSSTDQVIRLMNSLNVELDSLRPSTLFSFMETVAYNRNRKNNNLRFFEFGKIFNKKGDNLSETSVLSLALTGEVAEENWRRESKSMDFFDLKEDIHALAGHYRISPETSSISGHPLLDQAMAIIHDNEVKGVFGKVKKEILSHFGIRADVFFAEIFWVKWMDARNENALYSSIPSYPEMRRDLAILLDDHITYERVKNIANEHGGEYLTDIGLFDVYQDKKKDNRKSYAISLRFRSHEKTLTDKEVDTAMKRIMKALKTETGATIRE